MEKTKVYRVEVDGEIFWSASAVNELHAEFGVAYVTITEGTWTPTDPDELEDKEPAL